jgi:hypothetical protein
MTHRPLLRACALALLAAACNRSPTDPSRPGKFNVTFIGVPADAETFTPRAVTAGRVVGVASDGERNWAVEWVGGTFRRLLAGEPAGCHSEPLSARGAFNVGQVTCTASGDPAGQPVDAYGWATGLAVPRLFVEPHTFVGVNASGAIAGTVNPAAQFPQAQHRAFYRTGAGVVVLVPEGATGSEAAGITDAGQVVVTAFFACAEADEDCVSSRVMVWSAGAWTALPTPRGSTRVVAGAVSPAGHVAVYAFGEADQIYLYDLDDRDLDALPVIPGTRVVLVSANARGQVVGTGIRPESTTREASYGIVWGDQRQYDLSERIVDAGTARWHVDAALASDDEGRIAGTGINGDTGQEGAILLVPTRLTS